jgi:uncharacterized protein
MTRASSEPPPATRSAVTDGWPAHGLDIESLINQKWQPAPFRQFILKMHGRCNLACDYCYIYRMSDQNWSTRPMVMSPAILAQTARRIAEHAISHQLDVVDVVLHGGEPLLAGPDLLGAAAAILRRELPDHIGLTMQMQTNGVLLDTAALDVLAQHRIRVSVSLDGPPEVHDRHRTYANGRGSHEATARAIRLLNQEPYRELFAGLLCVIDALTDPVQTYESLLAFEPPKIDFLLPHGNWSAPPPFRPADPTTPYGDWLAAVFDRWYTVPSRETQVRTFDEIINLLLGGESRVETIGLTLVALVTVDTDGSMEQVDTLRSAYHGAAGTDLNVTDNSFDDALRLPAIAARQIGLAALDDACQRCAIREICGGGYYPHRYRQGDGFRNPSVYCPDLTRLITHIQNRVQADLAALSTDQVPGGSRSQSARRCADAATVSG